MNRATEYPYIWPGMAPALLIFLSFFFLQPVAAQEKARTEVHISIDVKDRPFQEVLSIIEYKTSFIFAYGIELVRQQKNVSITAVDISLQDLLTLLLRGTSLTYHIIGQQIVLQRIIPPSGITLSGYIKDLRTGETLPGASITIPAAGVGTSSNNYGFYSITLPYSDTLNLEVTYVGYKSLAKQVNAGDGSGLSFALEHNDEQEVINKLLVANDKREDNIKKNQSVPLEIPSEMILGAPSVSGSGDVIGAVEMLPGVQAGMDGTPGYFVRGGNEGQNLILLDEATLYNPSHIFGLVGIFNPPAIKHASLMKGGFPAYYGDHVSSVLDVVMKDGSNQQSGGIVNMGSISSGATLWGPLQHGKSSFLLSARRSTTDVLLRPFLHQNYFSNYYFYDVNAKLNFQLSSKDRLLFSFYNGRDNNNYTTDSTDITGINYSMHFGNTTFTTRWNHQYSGKLFANTSVEYNHYHQFLSATQNGYFAQLYSGIRDINAKTGLTYYLSPAHKISAGADYLYQTLYPASLSAKVPPTDSSSGIIPANIPAKTASRLAIYASDDMKIGRRFQLYLGVRAPFYFKPGAQYLNIEPRVALLYLIDPATSVKVSYTDMHQYIHLVQSYNASFPAEIWIGSSDVVRPQASREVSAGLFKNFKENVFQTSLELYYRRLDNQLLFGGGTTPTIDNNIEKELIFGKGWSYGAEFFIRKNRGRWTGWLAYTLAYAWQHFDSLNLGQSFPFAFDRRHLLDVATGYALTSHWKITANFFLASGRAFSLDTDTTSILNPGGNPLYPNRGRGRALGRGRNQDSTTYGIKENNYRLAPYDRLDLSVRYKTSRNIGRRVMETEWIFSVYNVYARRNSSFVYRTIDPSTKQVIAKQVPFIPVIPSIMYSLTF
ncbi:MAG TPA: TonB-dependent receptor [Puia sp.]